MLGLFFYVLIFIIMELFEIYKNLTEGINVYHGSTNDFDEFDIDKIGSGDGKSLGGWGIYFSDDENVSQRYYTTGGSVKPFTLKSGKYFDLDEPLDEGFAEQILNELRDRGVDEDNLEQFQTDYIDYIRYGDVYNKGVYNWLSYVLGSEKEASLFLESLGFIGNTMMDKWDTTARNYIIFNPKSIY